MGERVMVSQEVKQRVRESGRETERGDLWGAAEQNNGEDCNRCTSPQDYRKRNGAGGSQRK